MGCFQYHSPQDTIAAISTAQAPAAIGVVRISGPRAREIAGKVFRSAHGKTLNDIRGYRALFGHVQDENGEWIDEAIALNFRAPASFTGEDVVELSCHGGLYITRRLLRAVLNAGAAPAGPGEFTRRAFLNGKMGLTEAESVMQMVSARGEQAAKAALAGHSGALEKKIRSVRESLTKIAAHLSAWADYPEDDISGVTAEGLKKSLQDVRNKLVSLLKQFESGRALREGVDTVIAGTPNVGKSTLMNLLSGWERSIVTQVAGTTRDVVEDTVLFGGVPLRLADTAGLCQTEDPVEIAGVKRAVDRIRSAQLVLAVFDASRPLREADKKFAEEIKNSVCVAVINKADLPQKIDKEYIQSRFKHTVEISASSGTGLELLKNAVLDVLGAADFDPSQGVLYTERQRDAASNAEKSLEEALSALENGMTFDAVTISVDDAISSLLELTGERVTEEVVDAVFRQFCVGK